MASIIIPESASASVSLPVTGGSIFADANNSGNLSVLLPSGVVIDLTAGGGGGGGETLAQTLTLGNTTGGNNITMTSGDVINSSAGGSTLDLRYSSEDGAILLTSDGAFTGHGYASTSTFTAIWKQGFTQYILLNDGTSAKSIDIVNGGAFSNGSGVEITSRDKEPEDSIGYGEVSVLDNRLSNKLTILSTIGGDLGKNVVSISNYGSTINAGVVNSVLLGGTGLTASANNTAYVDNLNINTLGVGASINNLGIDASGNVVVGTIQTTTVTVTSAQVLNFGTTPVELIAAPGAGKAISVVNITCKLDFNTTAYAGNTDVRFVVQGSVNSIASDTLSLISNAAAINPAKLIYIDGGFGNDNYYPENAPLQVKMGSAVNPTTGDSDYIITVNYIVIDYN